MDEGYESGGTVRGIGESIEVFFFRQRTAYELLRSLVGSEMCIIDRYSSACGAVLVCCLAVLSGAQWFSVVLGGAQWCSVVLSGSQWFSVVLY